MAFLDDLEYGSPDQRQRTARPAAVQDLSWDDYGHATPPQADPGWARSDRLRKGVKWAAVLIVTTTIAFGAWLGLRRFPIATAAKGAASALARDGAAAPSETSAPTPPSTRSKPTAATVRRSAHAAEAIETVALNSASDIPIENPPAIESLNEGAEVTDSEVPTVEADPAVIESAPLVALDDENVYSDASAGVVAPQLVSLGFVERLMHGFDVRTSLIELMISKDGSVERAKLFLPSRSMEDALLLHRAKSFRFVPALRDGLPVRYRLVLQVAVAP